MRTVIPVGNSVKLVSVTEIGRGLRLPQERVEALLERLGVPVGQDYGPDPVVSVASLEAAIFLDLWNTGSTAPEVIKFHQMWAALSFTALDRAGIQKLLRRMFADVYKLAQRAETDDEPRACGPQASESELGE